MFQIDVKPQPENAHAKSAYSYYIFSKAASYLCTIDMCLYWKECDIPDDSYCMGADPYLEQSISLQHLRNYGNIWFILS
jgi:hypothetical protein